ncbi:MAG: DUF6428 family protein [Terrimicrobiaceae bacterium]|nr:DUF6428 family protein [Terrimicrobiaceae bacterium]
MNLSDLKAALAAHPDLNLAIRLPDGDPVPAHFHITEVGHVVKRFIDCGGDMHHDESCLLQAWVADDIDHRFTAGKFARVLDLFARLTPNETLPVEVEYEDCSISQYPVLSAAATDGSLVLMLGEKHTDCLAKEACGLASADQAPSCCAPGSGCC